MKQSYLFFNVTKIKLGMIYELQTNIEMIFHCTVLAKSVQLLVFLYLKPTNHNFWDSLL